MAEKTTETAKKPTARKPSATRRAAAQKTAEPTAARQEIIVKKRTFRPDEYVTVRNGFDGKLVYKSSKTGEKYVFDRFGDEHDMEIQELKKARNDSKKFFENNWFLLEDPDVIEYLGVGEYYKNAFSYDDFDKLTKMTAEEIAERMEKVSEGQKISIAHHARKMIAEGKIDSMKAITALEKGLGVQLIER